LGGGGDSRFMLTLTRG